MSGTDETVISDDGRRATIECPVHGAGPILPLLDPLDDTVYLYCAACDEAVLIADVLAAEVQATSAVRELDDLDPRLRKRVKAYQDGDES